LAKALAAADAKGVVHGNVRPDNVLIERDSGRVVLTNFGIAGTQEAGPASDARYTSPEQLRGETATGASDIFSLGALAYELLTGCLPYEGSSPLDMRSVRSDVPEELAQLLQGCVDNNPDARPAAEELVRQLASDERTEAPLDLMQPTQRAAEAFMMRVAVVSGLVIMAIGAAVSYWLYEHYTQ
jgi:serine/threonine protein kinase